MDETMSVWEWLMRRNSHGQESTQDNKTVAKFIPTAKKIYAIFRVDQDGEEIVQPLFKSERRAVVRRDRLEKRTGAHYYVAPLELRD